MRVFDSVKTMNKYHNIYKNLSVENQHKFELAVKELFDKKTVSEEGEYDTFKITEKDLITIEANLK